MSTVQGQIILLHYFKLQCDHNLGNHTVIDNEHIYLSLKPFTFMPFNQFLGKIFLIPFIHVHVHSIWNLNTQL